MVKALHTLEFEKPLRELEAQLEKLQTLSSESNLDLQSEIEAIEQKILATKKEIYSNLGPWQKVQLARHPNRPYTLDYIEKIFEGFEELHGDRAYRDDPAMVGGIAWLGKQPVMVLGVQKGRSTKENLRRNFGSPHPEGYRKALRLMKLAEKFGMPIVTFVDTPGAYPGIGSEERHVAEAIAVNIREMSHLKTPIVTIIIGEGGSGGALGIAVADKVLVLSNAYYSVISPEGCAAILWKDRAFAPDAAEALKLDPKNLLEFGIADEVLEEPLGGAHRAPDEAAELIKKAITQHFKTLQKKSVEELLETRYQKYRNLGVFVEKETQKEKA